MAIGALGVATRAEATIFYWPDSDTEFSQPAPELVPPPRKQRVRHHRERRSQKSIEAPTAAKPHGPLVIAVSINEQEMKIYDANGLFARTPVSTGMHGHSTPMGVFSVIQKEKLHHSNIYSGAPMPYMQRITWSGIAIHAGVLPGYPASHGCIRMPTAFAIKMYGWTRLGARVVVTPDEIAPASFSHPLLVTQKDLPEPIADLPGEIPAAKADKATTKSIGAETSLELRPTIGQNDDAKSLANAASSVPAQIRTADASPAASSIAVSVTPATGISAPEPAAGATPSRNAPIGAAPGDVTKPDLAEKKDESRLPGTEKVATPKRLGQIAMFISGKDSRLYVRQNFAPLFDAPVTIAPSDRPLGTHVFTAEADNDNANILHWSVISLPQAARKAGRRDETDDASRRRKMPGIDEMKALEPEPDSPAEALDRIVIPADIQARIAEALSTGSSIVVSDQGIAGGETGEGTDFIVSLR